MSYKETKAYQAHKLAGFPKINVSDQYEILITGNYNQIWNLLPELKDEGFPLGLLNEYITITKQELKEHLKTINYIEKQTTSYSETYDGFWLRKTSEGFVFFERERGKEFGHENLTTVNEVLDKYVKLIGWCCK